jgi:hypothetical protein
MNKHSKRGPTGARKARKYKTMKITYLYRDASNYKFWGEFCVLGELSLDDLRPYLHDREWFVPEKVGIPSLVPECRNEDDHVLHEFISIDPSEPALCPFSAEELIERIRAAKEVGWFSGMG